MEDGGNCGARDDLNVQAVARRSARPATCATCERRLWKLEGLAEYDVRRPLTPTGTNLLGLIKHLTVTEAWYFGEVFGRPLPERLPWRDDDADERADDAKLTALIDHKLQLADMWATEEESRAEIVDRYRRMCAHSDATIAALAIDAPGRVAWWPRPDVKLFNHGARPHRDQPSCRAR